MSLENVENMLPKQLFVRVNDSYIVSVNKITSFNLTEVRIGNSVIQIGKNYAHVFANLRPRGSFFME